MRYRRFVIVFLYFKKHLKKMLTHYLTFDNIDKLQPLQ